MDGIQPSLFDLSSYSQKQINSAQQLADVFNFEYRSGWPDVFGRNLYRWASSAIFEPVKTLSLFSGGGGLDIGFHDAGFTILNMIELEPRYADTLQLNCGENKYFNGANVTCIDIRKYSPKEELEIDFVIGGPPCQTFSAAGRRAAGVQGTEDERGMLFWEYVRLLEQLSPSGFLFENVYGLTGAQNGEAWQQIQRAFADVGYRVFHRVLDTADYGVPQHRERLFIVGVKQGDYLFPKPTHGPDSSNDFPYYTAAQAIEGVEHQTNMLHYGLGGRYGHLLDDIPPGLNYSFYTEKMGHPNPVFAWRSKFSDFLYKADPDKPVRTIKAQGGQYTGPFHWHNRRFTVGELKRLQTFPDSYHIEGGQQVAIQQIGNSVPPQIARILALSILDQLFGVDLPLALPTLQPNEALHFRQRKRQRTKIYKQKARKAISQLVPSKMLSLPYSREFYCYLSEGFALEEIEGDPVGDYFRVFSNLDLDVWQLRVHSSECLEKEALEIVIKPSRGRTWSLPTEQVSLRAANLSSKTFLILWKALEYELKSNGLKADLVQLCGYYQYTPIFQCEMKIKSKPCDEIQGFEWDVIKKVANGKGTRKIYSTIELGHLWDVTPELVAIHATQLKLIGYEVRNSNTNPQIPVDHFLIPYSFPTLSPQSVQLHKEL